MCGEWKIIHTWNIRRAQTHTVLICYSFERAVYIHTLLHVAREMKYVKWKLFIQLVVVGSVLVGPVADPVSSTKGCNGTKATSSAGLKNNGLNYRSHGQSIVSRNLRRDLHIDVQQCGKSFDCNWKAQQVDASHMLSANMIDSRTHFHLNMLARCCWSCSCDFANKEVFAFKFPAQIGRARFLVQLLERAHTRTHRTHGERLVSVTSMSSFRVDFGFTSCYALVNVSCRIAGKYTNMTGIVCAKQSTAWAGRAEDEWAHYIWILHSIATHTHTKAQWKWYDWTLVIPEAYIVHLYYIRHISNTIWMKSEKKEEQESPTNAQTMTWCKQCGWFSGTKTSEHKYVLIICKDLPSC